MQNHTRPSSVVSSLPEKPHSAVKATPNTDARRAASIHLIEFQSFEARPQRPYRSPHVAVVAVVIHAVLSLVARRSVVQNSSVMYDFVASAFVLPPNKWQTACSIIMWTVGSSHGRPFVADGARNS